MPRILFRSVRRSVLLAVVLLALAPRGAATAPVATSAPALVDPAERAALIALYQAADGRNWTHQDGWLGPTGSECSWYGVQCDPNNREVQALTLDHNGLLGALPPEISGLSRLRLLSLRGNRITTLPATLGDLPQLFRLDLSDNFVVRLPPALGRLGLEDLDLSGNRLFELPPELGDLQALVRLDLADNRMSELQPALGRLPQLLSLDLSGNRLARLPPELGDLPRLSTLVLSRNQLRDLPPELGHLATLTSLDLAENLLTGLPPELGLLARLSSLDLTGNRLDELPATIADLTRLTVLELSGNILTDLPAGFDRLQVNRLNLSSNRFTRVPDALFGLDTVALDLNLAGNRITEEIPAGLADLPLISLDLSSNPFAPGPLPEWLRHEDRLRLLRLRQTNRTGALPDWWGELVELARLDLAFNPFTPGPIPAPLLALPLRDLDLTATRRTGPLPARISRIDSLQFLRLDYNAFEGPIPPEWAGRRRLNVLTLRSNRLTGEVPPGLTGLRALRDNGGLDLRWNGLEVRTRALATFLAGKQPDGADVRATQTVPPVIVEVRILGPRLVRLRWQPIPYQAERGSYRVFRGPTAAGPWTLVGTTADKRARSLDVPVAAGAVHFLRVRTVTLAHAENANSVGSDLGPAVRVKTPAR